jgi:hypothetical protein
MATTMTKVTSSIRDEIRALLLVCKSVRESMDASIYADAQSIWKYGSYRQCARRYNDLLDTAAKLDLGTALPMYKFDLEKIPGLGDSWAQQQKEIFESVRSELSILIAYLENKLGLKDDEVQTLRYFIQSSLRRAVFAAPTREVEVQNTLEQLLIGRGMSRGLDYDRETGRVRVSAKEVVPDFLFARLGLALEVKLLREHARLGPLIDEINADIRAYSKSYSRVMFVVYDLGIIRDEVQFRADLEAENAVALVVVKH